jgi:hypothetical protein
MLLLEHGDVHDPTRGALTLWAFAQVSCLLVPNPAFDGQGVNPLRRWIWTESQDPAVLVHSTLLSYTLLLATSLGSITSAVNAVRAPDAQLDTTREVMLRLRNIFEADGVPVNFAFPPQGLLHLTRFVGFRIRVNGVPVARAGRPAVVYPQVRRQNGVLRPAEFLLSVSGQYSRTQLIDA